MKKKINKTRETYLLKEMSLKRGNGTPFKLTCSSLFLFLYTLTYAYVYVEGGVYRM